MKYKHPPDEQPETIKLVMNQMESMARRFAGERIGRLFRVRGPIGVPPGIARNGIATTLPSWLPATRTYTTHRDSCSVPKRGVESHRPPQRWQRQVAAETPSTHKRGSSLLISAAIDNGSDTSILSKGEVALCSAAEGAGSSVGASPRFRMVGPIGCGRFSGVPFGSRSIRVSSRNEVDPRTPR